MKALYVYHSFQKNNLPQLTSIQIDFFFFIYLSYSLQFFVFSRDKIINNSDSVSVVFMAKIKLSALQSKSIVAVCYARIYSK